MGYKGDTRSLDDGSFEDSSSETSTAWELSSIRDTGRAPGTTHLIHNNLNSLRGLYRG